MPKRATATSFGGKSGNRRGRGPAKGSGGAPPQVFTERLRLILERNKTVKNVETILDNPDHPKFDKMLDYVTERVHGKVPQAVEQKHDGEITVRVVRDE